MLADHWVWRRLPQLQYRCHEKRQSWPWWYPWQKYTRLLVQLSFRISMLTSKEIPSDLWVPLIVSIFKKGDKTNCGNYPCFLMLWSSLLASFHTASSPLPKRPFQSLRVVSDQHKGLLTWFYQHDRFRKRAENRPLYGFHWCGESIWLQHHRKCSLRSDAQRNIPEWYDCYMTCLHAFGYFNIDGESTKTFEVKTGGK